MFGDDADREQFFEAARRQSQREFEADNTNVGALIRWGGAMLELAHYKQGEESIDMIKEAITKLNHALTLDADKPDAYWCLGNAYTSLGFLCSDKATANTNFAKASEAFKHCHDKDPNNETYKKALEMCEKAPDYYDEIQSHIAHSAVAEASSKKAASAGGSSSVPEYVWDIGGWALLAAVVAGALLLTRGSAKPASA